jgi:hexosaminidase
MLLGAMVATGCRGTLAARPEIVPVPVGGPMLIPMPRSLATRQGAPFAILATTSIVSPTGTEGREVAEMLARLLRPATGFPLRVVEAASALPGDIRMDLDGNLASLGDEGYTLESDSATLRLRAFRPAGLFRGLQTLRQLLPYGIDSDIKRTTPWLVPALAIEDAPRFAWRGAMLDIARHFFTVREVEQFIDVLALYKLNTLHLHLSDDQGWRIEIRSRSLLAQVGGRTQVGGGAGGYYTQEEYAGIVRYALARYITVVPEIDMPGHSNAALTAYPALACGARPPGLYSGTEVGWSTMCVDDEGTYALIEDVVRELAAITPGPYLHIGGDEVEALTAAQYTRFVERVQDIVARHGKRTMGWEEIASARLMPTTIAQQWHSDSVVRALAYGAGVVLSPAKHTYLDMKYDSGTELGLHWAGYVGVRAAYAWDPATEVPGLAERDILGIEAPIWSETLRNITSVEYLAMPRLPALAEVGWSPQSPRDWSDFRLRLAAHAPRWRQLGINYFPSSEVPW